MGESSLCCVLNMGELFFIIAILLSACSHDKFNNISASDKQEVGVSNKPNIIVILVDDISYENITCNDGGSFETPNLDAMAATGVRFTNCHSTPLCSPSRFEIMTGKYNFRNYVHWGVMDTTERTFGNMLRDAGYATAVFGKWQLDGGTTSAKALGFNHSAIYAPFQGDDDDADNDSTSIKQSRYKDPSIYTGWAYMDSNLLKGKYGDDVFTDSVISFIQKPDRTKPYLVYYPMCLGHSPFQPTPDDAEFKTWNNADESDIFYPSMMKYMDKLVGKILRCVDSLNQNTIIIFVGDNGRKKSIKALHNGSLSPGGKGTTTDRGTHVPLIVRWNGHAGVGTDSSLIDFSDFLPTLADIAEINKPYTYGTLDGLSFYPQILGQAGTPRTFSFTYFKKNPNQPLYRWVQDYQYKLYDTCHTERSDSMFNYVKNINETNAVDYKITKNKTIKTFASSADSILNAMK